MSFQPEEKPRSRRFSIISAVYNVSAYLPDYLRSLDAQTFPLDDLEVVLVDDGSTDNSLDVIKEWQETSACQVVILTKENGGQASARNLGLEHATGEWVTFCDPDDYLENDYFGALDAAIRADSKRVATMFATHVITNDESKGIIADTHPLRRRFRDGDRVVNLDRSPDFFHMSGPTAVMNRELLLKSSIRFEEALRFSFEDAHFVSSYLLEQDNPTIGYVSSARYIYRKRASQDSSVQTANLRREKYTDVLKDGHLDLLRRARERRREVPMWLQLLLLYDVLWYFRADRRTGSPTRLLDRQTKEQFHLLISEVMGGISDEAIHSFEIMGTDRELRDALLLGYKHPQSRPTQVYVDQVDRHRMLTLLRYQYSGELPQEELRLKGLLAAPKWAKSQSVEFFGRTLFSRRSIWIPSAATFSVALDGTQMPLEIGHERRPSYVLRPSRVSKAHLGIDITRSLDSAGKPPRGRRALVKAEIKHLVRQTLQPVRRARSNIERRTSPLVRESVVIKRFANRPYIQRRFRDAWILMDRTGRASDNAEYLYRYLLKERPSVNAWFVLDRDSSDWTRLERDGFKLLEFGSKLWKAALLNADHYISSHLDEFITSPLDKQLYGPMPWSFTFLQHGVVLHDLSRWFNSKSIDLLITSTQPEYDAIAGDGSVYKFSSKEVKLTGLPRHDLLANLDDRQTPSRILLAPTWRSWLTAERNEKGQLQLAEGFSSSEYAVSWRDLCTAPELQSLASRNGLKISMLPHPALEEFVAEMGLPDSVEILRWDDVPFASLLKTSAVMVTDYSSTAFDAAYSETPVVYYQFDGKQVFSGGHIYEKGYFDYSRDGFGPVTDDASSAATAIIDSIHGASWLEEYALRRAATFPNRDGRNAERVYREIAGLRKPVPFKRAVQVLGR